MAFFEKNKSDIYLGTNKKQGDKEEPNWLHRLTEMREKRKKQADDDWLLGTKTSKQETRPQTPPHLEKKTVSKGIFGKKNIDKTNSSPQVKKRIYQYYLEKWQEEHNQLKKESVGTQVLLANKWTLKSDDILLQVDSVEEEENSILFFDESQQLLQATEQQIKENSDMQDIEDLPNSMIRVTVVKPNLDPNKNLCIVDEQVFIASIKAQLKPHLQDMLEGMIKNMLLNNYEIMLSCVQKEIQSEIPKVIEDILEYNAKSIFKK